MTPWAIAAVGPLMPPLSILYNFYLFIINIYMYALMPPPSNAAGSEIVRSRKENIK